MAPELESTTRPVVAVFDLDRTITRAGTYTPFLLHCAPAMPATVVRMAAALGAMAAYAAKRITRGALKARMLELFIAGATRPQVAAWAAEFVGRWLRSHLRPGAVRAIEAHRTAGHRIILVTASFDFYAQIFADRLGFHHLIATESVWDQSECLCPALAGDNCYGPAKLAAVKSYLAKQPQRSHIIAYSDHHSDCELLRWADQGVAVNPNGRLRALAQRHGLAIADWSQE